MDRTTTLQFDTFWNWLLGHPNCILRAGTPETVVYDDEDLYWHFATHDDGMPVVQVLRGKRLMSEIFLMPEQVSYVEASTGEQDGEYVFELVSDTEAERFTAYFFVLVHPFDGGEASVPGRVH